MSQTPGSLKKWLIASVLINVFLIGGVAGGLYQGSNRPHPPAPMVQHGLRKALAQLPEARRHQLRRLLRQTRAENQTLIAASRQAHLDVISRLQSPSLDRDALDADLDRARTADISLRTRVDATLADFAATLPVDERQKLAGAMTGQRPGAARKAMKE
jgi:uncharacterized membrane protein